MKPAQKIRGSQVDGEDEIKNKPRGKAKAKAKSKAKEGDDDHLRDRSKSKKFFEVFNNLPGDLSESLQWIVKI